MCSLKVETYPSHHQDHTLAFWLGDLNYRLNDLRTEEVKKLLAEDKLAQLVEQHDQLGQERLHRAVFVGWSEGTVRRDSQALLSLVLLLHYCALIGRELHSNET